MIYWKYWKEKKKKNLPKKNTLPGNVVPQKWKWSKEFITTTSHAERSFSSRNERIPINNMKIYDNIKHTGKG